MATREILSDVTEERDDVVNPSEISERIAEDTAPGKTNYPLIHSVEDVPQILEKVMDELNNWVEFLDVRVYRDEHIGIPCRYRWTIKRWAKNDMDQWLMDRGWESVGHLRADSRDHEPNELEARYRKRIDGYMVNVNIYVEFTEDVFERLQEEGGVKDAKRNINERKKLREFRKKKVVG